VEGESVGQALERLRKLLGRHRATWKQHKPIGWRIPAYFVKPTQVRRAKRFRRKVKARLGLSAKR